jgi:site-specific recombinase XerD
LELQEYLEEIRPKMISSIREENRRVLIDRLFFSERGNGDIKSSLYHMFRQIKKMNPSIKSGSVIRQSVITEWTKTIGIRQVQYMAGYKCVGSVERYRNYNMEALAEALKEYHPLQ